MGRGPKRHMKRLAAPKNWCLAKLGGIYAPYPSSGPHKIRECIPMILLLRNRLKYALTYDEAKMIAMQRIVYVDGKVRTDMMFPCGFQDVVSIKESNEQFRILYDTKGRFVTHKIHPQEAKYKLCRVKKHATGLKEIPFVVTHDGRTIRYVHPDIRVHDTIRIDIETGKVLDFLKFDVDKQAVITGGHNIGRVGSIIQRERHPGSVEIVHLRDSQGNNFATRVHNVFVIGSSEKLWISLPKQKGIRKHIIDERTERIHKNQSG